MYPLFAENGPSLNCPYTAMIRSGGDMNASQLSLENFAGLTGVGALQVLGWFFVIDGLTGFYVLVEQYAASASWQIFFSVAVVALAYLLGAVSSIIGALIVELGSSTTTRIYEVAGRLNTTASYLVLEDWLKKSAILKGSAVSVLVLAAGSVIEGQSGFMERFGVVGLAGGALGVGLSVLAALVARTLDRRTLTSLEALAGKE